MAAPSPQGFMKIGYAYREAKALLSAVELGVFTALSEGPLGVDELRSRIGIHERGARDFFDALVALHLLNRDGAGRYANTLDTAHCLDRSKPSYGGGELEFINAQLYERWNDLTAALRTGRPQTRVESPGQQRDRYADPAAAESFAKAMTAATLPVAMALAAKFPWHDYGTVADIGSAQGCLPVEIARAHTHLTGCGFDLPAMKPAFESYVRDHGIADRIRFHAGDFLQDPLPTANVLIMGRVLHNWDLVTKMMLLKKAYQALPLGGAIIVYERLIDDNRCVNTTALLSSLNMLVMTPGGFDFTGADCIGWMKETGFRDVRAEPLTADQTMVAGKK